jgi:hypothetical protein
MNDDEFPFKSKGGFWDLDDGHWPDEAESRPKSLLKTTEWGLMTIASLLAGMAFPPYFVTVMTLAFLNAGGLLWVTHLTEKERRRLRDFEADFRAGHSLEENGQWAQAVALYLSLRPRYGDIHQLVTLCDKRVEKIKREHPRDFSPSRPSKKKAAAKKPRRPARRPGKAA